MCMKSTDEGCVLREQQAALAGEVANVKERLERVEADMGKIRLETQDGFKRGAEVMRNIETTVANLAHDFGQRFNNIETTVVAEKVKWGETLRDILRKAAYVLLAGAAVAMGITAWRTLIK